MNSESRPLLRVRSDSPPPGSIVPYLRPLTNGVFAGDAASKDSAALDIVYRPVWPVRDPKDSTQPLATIPYGLTLVKPQLGLPGVGDWKTARDGFEAAVKLSDEVGDTRTAAIVVRSRCDGDVDGRTTG